MQSIFLLAVSGFVVCFALTPMVRALSHRCGAVDRPDANRKLHSTPIPRTGGVAIAAACLVAFAVFLWSPLSSLVDIDVSMMRGVMAAVLVVFVTGLVDDLVGLPPILKLAGQAMAASCAYAAGVEVLGVAGLPMHGWWSWPVTVIWLVACANALNLIDGVDGLAAGIGLIAASTTLFAALLSDNLALAIVTAPLVGALVAFLHYNFNPASIFLGDCGSLTIGFVLGCFGAIWSQKATTLMGMTAPLMALSVPLLDTSLSIVRRYLRHQPIFRADRNHIHHRLLDQGFSSRDVAFALCGVCAIAAGFALVQTSTHSRYGGVIVVVFAVLVWLGVRSLGYVEFQAARYLATTGVFRHVLDVHVSLNLIEDSLTTATTADDYWLAVGDAGRRFGFVPVVMRLDGTLHRERHLPPDLREYCRTRIPLPSGDYVEFAFPSDVSVQRAVALNGLTDALHRVLWARELSPPHALRSADADADVEVASDDPVAETSGPVPVADA